MDLAKFLAVFAAFQRIPSALFRATGN